MATQSHRGSDEPTPDRAALHELANLERNLRDSSTHGVDVSTDPNARSARIYFDTWETNEHHRGSLTASLVTAIAETDAWGLTTVHDPLERDNGQALIQSAFSLLRTEDDR